MTRVLCLTSWYPPHHTGGYELSCRDVMTRLADRGHHVEVLTSDHRHPDVPDGDPAPVADVHRTLSLYFRDGRLWQPPVRRRLAVERHNHAALEEALASSLPDVVSVWHVGAMSLGLLTSLTRRRIPLVFAVSDDWPIYAPALDPWTRGANRVPGLARVIEAASGVPARPTDLDEAGAFCFISDTTRSRCRTSSAWAFPRSTVVYSGIDGHLFQPRSNADRPWRGQLLYVGRIDQRKGLATLVRALRHLPDHHLVVDGRPSEDERAMLQGWIAEAGVDDRVTVQCSDRADLPAVYADADVCVFPSEWEEPFGLVPLEAMACGTPVVATGVGGSGEFLVDGVNCLLFTAGDPVDLARAVTEIRDRVELQGDLRRQGFETARFFDAEHLTDAIEAWHTAAAHGYADGSPLPRRPPHRASGRAGP